MQVGDIVKYFLTDQLGVVLDINPLGAIHVVWTTQGDSLFGPGHKEAIAFWARSQRSDRFLGPVTKSGVTKEVWIS